MPTPTLPPDLGELWKSLRTAWLADPVINLLLAQTNEGGSIYLEMPHQKIDFPSMTFKPQSPEINVSASYLGVSRQTIVLNAYSLDRYHGGKVFAAFQQQWSIPRLAAEFTSTNWRITEMVWSHPIDVGKLQISNIDQDIWQFSCQCRMFVRRRDTN